MGAGFAQLGILTVLSVVGLPLFFFGLMSALDRFERSLSQDRRPGAPPQATAQPAATTAGPAAAAPAAPSETEVTLAVSPPLAEPAAAV